MSFHWKLLLNTVVAVIGLVVALRYMVHRRTLAWSMVAAAVSLTLPYYTCWLLGMLGPASEALLNLRVGLMQLAFLLQFPAYIVILVGSVLLAQDQRRGRQQDLAVPEIPTVQPYGRSAFDTPPDPAALERGHQKKDNTRPPSS